jgi:hypothetical protein
VETTENSQDELSWFMLQERRVWPVLAMRGETFVREGPEDGKCRRHERIKLR